MNLAIALDPAFEMAFMVSPVRRLTTGAFDILVGLGPDVAMRALVNEKVHQRKGWVGPKDIVTILQHPQAEALLRALPGALRPQDPDNALASLNAQPLVPLILLTRPMAARIATDSRLDESGRDQLRRLAGRGCAYHQSIKGLTAQVLVDVLLGLAQETPWPADRRDQVVEALLKVVEEEFRNLWHVRPRKPFESHEAARTRITATCERMGVPNTPHFTLDGFGLDSEVNASTLREKLVRRTRWEFYRGLKALGLPWQEGFYLYIPTSFSSGRFRISVDPPKPESTLRSPKPKGAKPALGTVNISLPNGWLTQVRKRGGAMLVTSGGEKALFLHQADEKHAYGLLWRKNRDGQQEFALGLYAAPVGKPARRIRFYEFPVRKV